MATIQTLQRTAVVGGLFLLVVEVSRFLNRRKRRQYLKEVAAACVRNRDAKIHQVLEQRTDLSEVHELTATEIREKVVSGDLSASDVVLAFAQRCARYGRSHGVNAITEEFYDDAFKLSKSLDPNSAASLLFGVPVSVKDCIGLAGALMTGGLACRAEEKRRSEYDSVVVRLVKRHGGLPMVRGNVSQCMMLPEAENNIFGRTVNPWDIRRTPGGSSGGEAALVAMRCVPLAIGTDVGGSVRIPAAFNGVCGFKPTPGRISKRGCMVPRVNDRHGPGMIIPSVIGPIAKSVEDCAQFMRAVLSEENFKFDVEVPPFPFNEDRFARSKKPKKIGYFVSDGWFEPCKAAKRAVTEVVDLLRQKDGYIIEEIKFPTDGWETYNLYLKLSSAEGNMRGFTEGLEGEELLDLYSPLKQAANLPNCLRPIVAALIDDRRGGLVRSVRNGGITSYAYWQLLADLTDVRKAWAKLMEKNCYDAILHPSLPLPALYCGTSKDLTAAFSYTMLANLLLWPEGCVPVSTVRNDEQTYPASDIPANQRDAFAENAAKTMEDSAGLPISVSVLCPPYRDEECLQIMQEIEELVNFKEKPTAYLRME